MPMAEVPNAACTLTFYDRAGGVFAKRWGIDEPVGDLVREVLATKEDAHKITFQGDYLSRNWREAILNAFLF